MNGQQGTSPSDVAAVLDAGIAAWNSGDVEGALEFIDPEIEWHTAQLLPDVDEVYRGHEGVKRFWALFVEPWEQIRIGVDEVLAATASGADGTITVKAHFRARGRDAIELDLDVFQVWHVRAGKLIEFRAFTTAAEALAAAGI